MKIIIKTLAVAVTLLVLTGGLWIANVGFYKPYSINLFYERVFVRFLFQSPELMTTLGLLRPLGIHYFDRRWDDRSLAHEDAVAAFTAEQLATLRSYDRSALTADQQLSYDILQEFLANLVEGHHWRLHDYPVNPTAGVQSEMPSLLLGQHPLQSRADVDAYLARLRSFGSALDPLIENLKSRQAAQILPPRFVVEKSLTQMRNLLAPAATEHPLYRHLAERLPSIASIDESQRQAILNDAADAIETQMYPAYQRLISYFESLLTLPLNNSGVWAQPEGDAYYAYTVKSQTTSDLDPDKIHELGLAEVARIEGEMDALLRGQGLSEGSVGARMASLRQDPRYLYPNTDEGRSQMLADYQKIIDEINAGLAPYFDIRPTQSVKVERVPTFKEASAPGAYYEPGSLDGSRPGTFFVNLRSIAEQPRWAMRTLAYHEAIPGHHFQIATSEQLTGVPQFRRILPFNAFQEGWALYAEHLAWEAGFEKDPLDNLGRLQAEMFRAVRLVVDTGLHRKRWTREQAIQYMLEKTGMGETEVTAEIERYLVWPAQALGYKLGMLKILELREYAKTQLGDHFDIRQFHDQVIGAGALPLPVLDARVRAWVAQAKHPPTSP